MPKRTCVITPGGARVCGRVQNTPTVVQACVASVLSKPGAKRRGMTTGGAFAICTASAQKRGIVKPGTRELTRKGARADAGISRNRRATTERRYEQALQASGEPKPCVPTKAQRDKLVQAYAIYKYSQRGLGVERRIAERLQKRYMTALNAILTKCNVPYASDAFHAQLDSAADAWLNTQAFRGAGKWW